MESSPSRILNLSYYDFVTPQELIFLNSKTTVKIGKHMRTNELHIKSVMEFHDFTEVEV